MKIKKTDRGFDVAEFDDCYGQKCSLQKSSLATKDAIWLGIISTGPHMSLASDMGIRNSNGRMHLTQLQVKKLIPHLIKFVETGELS